jgi:hypothetical protein
MNLAQSTAAFNAVWFIDFGASSHITLDLNCLTNYAPYQSNSVVHIGNGHDLDISHIENCSLSISKLITLSSVLHVP